MLYSNQGSWEGMQKVYEFCAQGHKKEDKRGELDISLELRKCLDILYEE